jgi:hypothetical protein
MLLAEIELWPYALGVFLLGFLLILYGTGFLQKNVVRPILRSLRNKRPIIAVISDLPWNDNIHPWAWADMCPQEWCSRITCEAKKDNAKVPVKQIKIKSTLTRFFLDRYSIILNPYGSAYPEVNIRELPVLKATLDYVLNRGLFVNVADIPFYWAYDPQRQILYDLVKHSYQYVPFEYEGHNGSLTLKSLSIQSIGPFTETPFVDEVRASVINTETPTQNGEPNPDYRLLKVKDGSLGIGGLDSVAINRAVILGRKSEYKNSKSLETGRIQSIVEELDKNGQLLSPICYVNFGEGKFLVSLLFLEYEKQKDAVKEWVVNLLCRLILKEVKKQD